MARRKRSRGLGYNRGRGVPITAKYQREMRSRRKAIARRECPALQRRISEAIATSIPTQLRMQPAFFHRLKLAEDAAFHGFCERAYREIGQAKRFGKKHQTRGED